MTAFLAPAQVLGRAYLAPATPPPAAVPEGIVNDRDVLLENAQIKVLNAPGAGVLLIASTPVFRESAAGVVDPEEITFTATLVGLVGTVSFSSTGTTGLATSGKVATLARANMTGTRAAVTAHVTVNGQTFSSNPCMVGVTTDGVDGTPGTPGLTGNTVAQAFLYTWSTVTPENPLGTATFTPAAGKNTAYDISDGWTIDPTPNPGVPLAMLWVAVKPVSAPAGTASVSVTYEAGASIIAYSRNGADGLPGIKSAQIRAYRWGNGPAPTIAGTSTYSWPSATYDNVPINWSVTKPASPGPGYTLFEATVNIVETAGAGSSQVDWTTAAIVGTSYIGLNGSGSSGDSAMIAYTLVDGVTLNVTPDTITKPAKGRPVSGDWGSTRAWTAQPSQPTLGQAVMQSNGIYNGVLDEVVWGVPYLSNWRVGTLSAITANMGAINAGSLNIGAGNSIIDINGFASFRKLTIYNDAGQVMFSSQNGLTILGAAPGTANSEIVVGGRNLLPDSGFERGTHPCDSRNNVKAVVFNGSVGAAPTTYSGSKSLFMDTDGGDAYLYIGGPQAPVVPGRQYTLSFYYKSDTSGTILSSSTFFRASDGTHIHCPLSSLKNQTWTRHVQSWTCPAGVTSLEPRFGINCTGYSWLMIDCIQIEEGNKATQWSPAPEDHSLSNQGLDTFRVVSIGAGGTGHPVPAGLYKNGFAVAGAGGYNRSYSLRVIDRATGTLVHQQFYDVYGNGEVAAGRGAAQLAADLNYFGSNRIIILWTHDEPALRRTDSGLLEAMYRCGASRAVFGSPAFQPHSAYVLVGIPGCGEGNGAEAYRGNGLNDPNAWVDVSFNVVNGDIVGISGASSVGNLVNTGLTNAQASADAANAALPGINTAIAAKLSKTGNEEIYGQKSLMSQYALLVGTVNDGIIYGSTGLYGRKAGKTTFSVGADGTAIFSDQLVAAYGSFGNVWVAPGGSLGIGSTGYNTDPGIWFGVVNGVPKMSICSANGTSLLFNGSTLAVLGDITARSFSTTGGRFTANTAGEVRADLVDINRRLVMQTGTLDAAEVISGTYYNAADAAYYNYPPGTVLKVDIAQVVLTDIYDFNVYATNANQPYYVAAYFDGPTTRNSSGWNGASVQFILNAKAESIRTYSNTGNYGDNTRVCITFTVTIKFIEGSVSSFKLPLAKWILYKL